MGREIKFRAWDTETKEMNFDFLNKHWLRVCIESPYVELMQYTGLTDKNGEGIYEGDILQIPDLYETPENTSTTYHTAAVDFEEYGFRVDGNQLCEDYQYISDECEVIGNIYENPELLEV